MPAPSQLAIRTSAVTRLLKEETSYEKEMKQQEARIAKLEQGPNDENGEYQLKQERQALKETQDIFPPLSKRIAEAVTQLQQRLAEDRSTAPSEEVTKAEEALNKASSRNQS